MSTDMLIGLEHWSLARPELFLAAATALLLMYGVLRGEVEFLAPRFRRHPRDGALVTQLVRPLVRSVYGVGLDEPHGLHGVPAPDQQHDDQQDETRDERGQDASIGRVAGHT